jgi:hypothetical protein
MVTPTQQKLIEAQLAPARIGQAISTAVAVKARDAAKMEGAAVLQLLEAAGSVAQPTPGDPLVAKATGLGSLIDVIA